jgi:hypothetical protein
MRFDIAQEIGVDWLMARAPGLGAVWGGCGETSRTEKIVDKIAMNSSKNWKKCRMKQENIECA